MILSSYLKFASSIVKSIKINTRIASSIPLTSVLLRTVSSVTIAGKEAPLLTVEQSDFQRLTLQQRLPTIAKQLIEDENFPPARYRDNDESRVHKAKAMKEEISSFIEPMEKSLTSNIPPLKESDELEPYVRQNIENWNNFANNKNWDNATPAIITEMYFYRLLLQANNYYVPIPSMNATERKKTFITYGVDPFIAQKRASLNAAANNWDPIFNYLHDCCSSLENEANNTPENRKKHLAFFLKCALMGNRADLSLHPDNNDPAVGISEKSDTNTKQFEEQIANNASFILSDDSQKIADYLEELNANKSEDGKVRVDLIVDNAGYELLTDVVLSYYLIKSNLAQHVVFHFKKYPVFVSDATRQDFSEFIDILCCGAESATTIASRLLEWMNAKLMSVEDEPIWTDPCVFTKLPDEVRSNLNDSDLVILKGDANFRRLVGDGMWQKSNDNVQFSDVASHFPGKAVAAIRTNKAETHVGIEKAEIERATAADSDWQVNGKWGTIQFRPPVST